MPLSARTIAENVLALQRHADLDNPRWTEDDVHWWPLYRTEIYRLLFAAQAGPASPRPRPGVRLGPALRASTREDVPTPPHAVWLVSDGLSYAPLEAGLQVERFCGPLWQRCARAGIPALVVDRASPAPIAMREPARWCAPSTRRAKLLGTLRARLPAQPRHTHLTGLMRSAASAAGLPAPGLDAHRMQAMAHATLRLADRVERRLRDERVRAVFIVSYYDVAGYAFTLAAARAGVPSVDVQHGVAGRYHMAYDRWPSRHWRLLPRWFWTWTDSDAAVIAAWAPAGAHRALRGGHPFLDAWREGQLTLASDLQPRLEALLARSGACTRILVTLQPQLVHAQALEPLLQAMARCRNAFWWLRLHPMGLGDRDALEGLLSSMGIAAFDIDVATALPLPALLPLAHLHATHSSSTFIEAATLGVVSVLWSEYGAELAEGAIADGSAHFAADGHALQVHVERCTGRAPPAVTTVALQQRDALREILETRA
jgi:hypothetical protein